MLPIAHCLRDSRKRRQILSDMQSKMQRFAALPPLAYVHLWSRGYAVVSLYDHKGCGRRCSGSFTSGVGPWVYFGVLRGDDAGMLVSHMVEAAECRVLPCISTGDAVPILSISCCAFFTELIKHCIAERARVRVVHIHNAFSPWANSNKCELADV